MAKLDFEEKSGIWAVTVTPKQLVFGFAFGS
jgi:hypothetical protein